VLIASGTHEAGLAVNPMASAYSTDGCALRIGGTKESSLVSTSDIRSAVPIAPRASPSPCAPPSPPPPATVVNPAPTGGVSGCWTPRVEEDASTAARFAPLRQAMLSAEELLRKNTAYLATPAPVRFRTSLSAGPFDESGARMHIKAVPERK